MTEINLVDQTLKNYHSQTELSIQLSLNGFSFCIVSLPDRAVRAFRHYRFEGAFLLEDILNRAGEILHRDELLRLPYQKIRVMYITRTSTLIPFELFKPEQTKKLLEFNQPVGEFDEIHFNPVSFCASNIAFTVQTYLAGLFTEKFRNVVFYNQATAILKVAELNYFDSKGIILYIQLNKEFFDIAVTDNGKLIFYNNFLFSGSEDLTYFILYVCKQLTIDVHEAIFQITGELVEENQIVAGLPNFFNKIKPVDKLNGVSLTPVTRKIPLAKFASLLTLSNCE
jgi:hypothetical protein